MADDGRGERLVRVSIASLRQRFHGCEPRFIAEVCHSKCCDAPTRPTGTLITIHPSEEAAIRARGAEIVDGLLVSPNHVCPFKTEAYLCALHGTPDKPFGCIASPFTLNGSDCLIVRNRYRMLPCYSRAPKQAIPGADEWPPAYVAFRASLDLIFGDAEAARVVGWLDAANAITAAETQITAMMPMRSYEMLKDNDAIKKASG